ncbi:Uncharacterized protein dnm_042640 [Desulfonema magnum]|uniref:Uncharacterized protein n=1 Tax=Desulfonema magnum TaxID=45655 RepID=A0A975BME2_9BACT|nr:Uncharacterized protein dnm_042640 [Desulfonema magnum]
MGAGVVLAGSLVSHNPSWGEITVKSHRAKSVAGLLITPHGEK